MIVTIPLQAIPNQETSIVLNQQECRIQIRQLGSHLFATLTVDDSVVFRNAICLDRSPINGFETLGFSGVLYFVDTRGNSSPQFDELADRYRLCYASEDESVYDEVMNVNLLRK